MKLTKRVLSVAIMSVMGAAYLPTAQADVSATLSASNMYLWRGQSISNPGPEFAGSLDYKHSSGLYAGVWGSSEGPFDSSSETDLYVGYSGTSGDFSYGAALYQYLYSAVSGSLDTGADRHGGAPSQPSEVVLTGGFSGVTFTAYCDTNNSKKQYLTLGYAYDKYSVLVGTWLLPSKTPDGDLSKDKYTHIDAFFQATPEIKFGLSKIVKAAEVDTNAADQSLYLPGSPISPGTGTTTTNNGKTIQNSNPLFYVSYSKAFNL